MAGDVFQEARVVLFELVVRHAVEILQPQRLHHALPPVRMVEERRIGLPVDEGIAVVAPVARLAATEVARGRAVAEKPRPVDRTRLRRAGLSRFAGEGCGAVAETK
jgi:hypothetical protein